MVGFIRDRERAVAAGRYECVIRGKGGDFARVSLLPAIVQSAEDYARQSFDAPASPLPELGPEAMFVAVTAQPHVVFPMGPLIIGVEAVAINTPSRATMIELATRVREILTAANS